MSADQQSTSDRNHYREFLDSLDRTVYASQILRCAICLSPHLCSIDVAQHAQMVQARDGVDWTCHGCTIGDGAYAEDCHGRLETRDPSTLVGFDTVKLHRNQRCANDNWRLWADATSWARGVEYRGISRGELVPSISGNEIELLSVGE